MPDLPPPGRSQTLGPMPGPAVLGGHVLRELAVMRRYGAPERSGRIHWEGTRFHQGLVGEEARQDCRAANPVRVALLQYLEPSSRELFPRSIPFALEPRCRFADVMHRDQESEPRQRAISATEWLDEKRPRHLWEPSEERLTHVHHVAHVADERMPFRARCVLRIPMSFAPQPPDGVVQRRHFRGPAGSTRVPL